MQISDRFDAGNIEVRAIEGDRARLAIRPDPGEDGFFQWFNFRLSGVHGRSLELEIENAGEASYPKGWEDYRACASYDRDHWFRCETDYAKGVLTIRLTPAADSVWVAYFPPYSRERHHDLIAACQTKPGCRHEVLGRTLDGEDIDLLTIGEPGPDKRAFWAIARQHPGETQAEWWMEGFLARLLDPDDGLVRRVREAGVFYIVPNMNPDGSRRGHLRTNACGANLNREWDKATPERSPEVHHVLAKMDETGLDFCLDVHGDEGLPYCFIAGGEGVPGFSERQDRLLTRYKEELARQSRLPDRAWLSGAEAGQLDRAFHLDQAADRPVRCARHDAGDALQGQCRRAGSGAWLVAGALPGDRAVLPRRARPRARRPAMTRVRAGAAPR